MLVNYESKKALKAAIGQKLVYRETSMFGEEFKDNGSFVVAYRPQLWKNANGGREFFAQVTMKDGLIFKVK